MFRKVLKNIIEIKLSNTECIKARITGSASWTARASSPLLVHGPSPHVAPPGIVAGDDGLVPAAFLKGSNMHHFIKASITHLKVD